MAIDEELRRLDLLDGFWLGARSEEQVLDAELSLGVAFPRDYRTFVMTLGCGNVGPHEFYGVIDSESVGVPSCVGATRDARRASTILPDQVVLYDLGNGDLGVLDCVEGHVDWVSVTGARERAAASFTEFLRGRMALVSD